MKLSTLKRNYFTKEKLKSENIVDLINYLYPNKDECFMRFLSKKKTRGKTRAYNINSLKDENKLFQVIKKFGNEDVFLSLNEFRTMERGTRDNIFCLNTIAVDVDYKKVESLKNLEPEQVINLLELEKFEQNIPTPNLIEYGNQIRLIYKLYEPVYVPKYRDNVLILARRISQVFAKELEEFGAESQNLESYLRLPGSINSKNNSEVNIIFIKDSVEYELRDLQELWLDELPKWWKKKKGKVKDKNKVVKLHNVYSLNNNRLLDFEKIQEYLNLNKINELRARLCFLYRNYVLIRQKYQKGELEDEDYQLAEKEMLRFNSQFKNPMRNNVIEGATRCVNRKQYLYKNETLVNFLELDFELCENLELQSIYKIKTREERNRINYEKNKDEIKDKLKKEYKEKLKKAGRLTKKEQNEILRKKIKVLKTEGLLNREISKQLNIPLKTLERHITFMKKNGLL
ncbi:helix-turn-helix domain-containing protein (plasmid) [Clostridium perfringens]|uniref:DNA-binding response regulator n=1 Tax=Clostridium perfringens TaxID=1502 RepID=UPI0022485030|nr:DNA-binding response regulator [Clostridium perfringens]MCX0386726.1 DNA-binding response regulator [Clostridium perfringens]